MSHYRKPIALPLALIPSLLAFILTLALVYFQYSAHTFYLEYYWSYAAIIALVALISGWTPNHLRGQSTLSYLFRQIVHWGIALALIYAYSFYPNALDNAGMNYASFMVGVLAFAAVLDAIHLDIKFIFFGLFLALISVLLQGNAGLHLLTPYLNQYNLAYFVNKPLYLAGAIALVGFVLETILLMFQRSRVNARIVDMQRAKGDTQSA